MHLNSVQRSRTIAVLFSLLALTVVSLACWSNDTLFIPPTETPTPTPIPPTSNYASKFNVGNSVLIVGQGLSAVYLTDQPEPETRTNRVANASCYPNSTTQILAVQRVADVTYYQIACTRVPGWFPESKLRAP